MIGVIDSYSVAALLMEFRKDEVDAVTAEVAITYDGETYRVMTAPVSSWAYARTDLAKALRELADEIEGG